MRHSQAMTVLLLFAATATVPAFLIAAGYGLPPAHAATAAGSGLLWVPDRMIQGEQYHGMVLSDPATPTGMLAVLSSGDGSVATVPDSVSVLPYRNHAVFQINPVGTGDTEILAILDGRLHSAPVRIFSSYSEPDSIVLTLAANRTRAESVTAYATVLDRNGLPVPVAEDTRIRLATTGALSTPEKVTVKNGTSAARFEVGVRGTGSVIATADGLGPDTADIERLHEEFAVRVAVAPDIAMPDSYVHYYVWLERDGRPYRPPHVVDATIQSGNLEVARLEENPSVKRHEGQRIHLVGGVAHGVMYTGAPGHATITAGADGFGSAQDDLFVGTATIADTDGDSGFTFRLHEQDILNAGDIHLDRLLPAEPEPNALISWVYPPVTDGQAWAVVATYHVDTAERLESGPPDESGRMITSVVRDAEVTPVWADGVFVHVSSDPGLEHDGTYQMGSRPMKVNAIEFEVYGSDQGSHEITVSAQDMRPDSASVEVVPDHLHDLDLHIVELPLVPHVLPRDLAMVSLVDGTGAAVNARDVLNHDADLYLSADSALLSENSIKPARLGSAAAVIGGTITGDSTEVTVTLDGVGSASRSIRVGGATASLEVLAPGRVHVGEDFPFAVHELNHKGMPMRKADGLGIFSPDASVVTTAATGGLMAVVTPGTSRVSVVSSAEAGATEHEFVGFENPLNIEIHLEKTGFRVGEEIRLEVTNPIEADYTLLTDFPFEQTGTDGGTFLIMPDVESASSVLTVTASRDGYATASASATVSVQRIFSVDVGAADTDGRRLYIPFEMTAGGVPHNNLRTPYHTDLEPKRIRITFSEEVSSDGAGYVLESVRVNDKDTDGTGPDVFLDGDIEVAATYGRVVLVSVTDGTGSGVYRYGDIVRVSAPDMDRVSFLVRDVFDGWVGLEQLRDVSLSQLSSSVLEFAATEDMDITATYREDYTYLMAVVLVPLSAAGLYAVSKNTTGFKWAVQNMLEGAVRPFGLAKKPGRQVNTKTGKKDGVKNGL